MIKSHILCCYCWSTWRSVCVSRHSQTPGSRQWSLHHSWTLLGVMVDRPLQTECLLCVHFSERNMRKEIKLLMKDCMLHQMHCLTMFLLLTNLCCMALHAISVFDKVYIWSTERTKLYFKSIIKFISTWDTSYTGSLNDPVFIAYNIDMVQLTT